MYVDNGEIVAKKHPKKPGLVRSYTLDLTVVNNCCVAGWELYRYMTRYANNAYCVLKDHFNTAMQHLLDYDKTLDKK